MSEDVAVRITSISDSIYLKRLADRPHGTGTTIEKIVRLEEDSR